jgi:hypothetical protein
MTSVHADRFPAYEFVKLLIVLWDMSVAVNWFYGDKEAGTERCTGQVSYSSVNFTR